MAAAPSDSSLSPAVTPFDIPANRGAAALAQTLKKLRTRASVLMITAHPDDEDGGTLTYQSRGVGARVTLLTLNRGEGGANVMSSDFWDALGLVRTHELLAAGRYYGVDQYWTRVCDYGFSKTLEESLGKWTDERVLADVVRVVRRTRPLVITSVFVGGPSDGHGNHQTAGQMAKEVFTAAADPQRFPEQIQEGLRPWKALKYYALVPFSGNDKATLSTTVTIPTGTYDPLLGESYSQLSHEGLGNQKSQNGGSFLPNAGNVESHYHRFSSLVSAGSQESSFYDGIDVSLAGIAALASGNGEKTAFLSRGLHKIDSSVEAAMANFRAEHPDAVAPYLAEGLKRTNTLLEEVAQSHLPAAAKFDVRHELVIKQTQFNTALVESLGLSLRATVQPDTPANPLFALFMGDPDTFRMAIPGQEFGVDVAASQQSTAPVVLQRVYLEPASASDFAVTNKTAATATAMTPNQRIDRQFGVKVSPAAQYTRPYFSRPSIEQPYYDILNARDLNLPLSPYPLTAWAEASYCGVAVKLGQIVQTTRRVNGAGVVFEPLVVGPAVSVQVSPRAGIVPLSAREFPLSVTVRSNVKGAANGTVSLHLPAGWKSEPAQAAFQTEQDGETRQLAFTVAPANLGKQSYQLTAVANYAGKAYAEGYTITGYAGVLPYFLYDPSAYRVVGTDVAVAPGLRVAYVTGSGDEVPSTLSELGIKVSYLSASDLANADLSSFDVVLLGVRAYAARPELATYNGRLLDYVKAGGTLIVQYNTPEFDHNFGPYPYKMGEEPEEVTDEDSKVQILDPTNPVFNWPNRITEADFQGWVEERGSKFLTSWDNHYSALLETHDAGQAPQKGGLLYARYGKGIYIYNAYAFYRELPEGVPGAFRLFANLLSLPKNPGR